LPIQTQADADIEPVLGVGLVGAADQVLAFLLDRLGQPQAAHVRVRAIVKDRVLFDRHLLGKVVALLGPALELLAGALAFAKKGFPGVRRALVIPAVHLEKGVDEFIGAELALEGEHGWAPSGAQGHVQAVPLIFDHALASSR